MMGLGLIAVLGMVGAIPLGFLSGRIGPVPHAAAGVIASIVSIIVHVRRGGGADLGASLLLGLGVFLGVGVPDGVVDARVHGALSIAGVALSAWVHLGHLRGAARSAPTSPQPPGHS